MSAYHFIIGAVLALGAMISLLFEAEPFALQLTLLFFLFCTDAVVSAIRERRP